MKPKVRLHAGTIAAFVATLVCAGTVLAQPGETPVIHTCTNQSCVDSGSTLVACALTTESGCCCKESGDTSWTCKCKTDFDCLNSGNNCRGNAAG